MTTGERTFKSTEACRLAGVTFRQLDYWDRSGVLRPTQRGRQRNGHERRYTVGDLERLTLVRTLIDAGQRLDRCRLVLAAVRSAVDDGVDVGWLLVGGDWVSVGASRVELLESLSNLTDSAVLVVSYSDVRRVVWRALNRHDLAVA